MSYIYLFFITFAIHCDEVMTHWLNDYDQPVDFHCPDNKTIYYWRSIHNSHYEDRMFDLRCQFLEQTTALTPTCQWTGFVNSYDHTMDFYCPSNGYINGFYSVHNSEKEDRIMKFRCCNLPGMCVQNCRGSGWVNSYDQEALYTVPIAEVLHGVASQHDNDYEDRMWTFTKCYYQRC